VDGGHQVTVLGSIGAAHATLTPSASLELNVSESSCDSNNNEYVKPSNAQVLLNDGTRLKDEDCDEEEEDDDDVVEDDRELGGYFDTGGKSESVATIMMNNDEHVININSGLYFKTKFKIFSLTEIQFIIFSLFFFNRRRRVHYMQCDIV
jgi:hypothetical protein